MGLVDLCKKFLYLFMSTLTKILGFIPALVYGYVYSEFFTKATYRLIGERANKEKEAQAVLDIGTATGHPLHSIIHKFKNAEVIGIDYDPLYIPACTKLFQPHKNVTIKEMNFYDLQKVFPDKYFDVIIFGSSFMIMPDRVQAIQLAKRRLNKGGKIYFLLTLYSEKNSFNRFMERVKPYLKYATTVEFGQVTYKQEFNAFLKQHGMKITLSQRCQGNNLLKFFKFYIYETQLAC